MTELPSRHDGVTITCPVCHHPYTPTGRRRYCSDACRSAAYRRRRDTPQPVVVPARQPRRPITIYECATCANRALGEQRCTDCNTFMTRIGIGGTCPHCFEPLAINELLDQKGDPNNPTQPSTRGL